ncbi:hypothetical protein OIU35_14000 [Boseaceae bacterium BT-24-1]|nr:hypothetical protein [Boseaceae bacterium BT-24-1]
MHLVIPGTDIHPYAAPMERAFQFCYEIFVDDRDWSDLDHAGGLVVALRMSFNRETLQSIQEARGSEAPVLHEAALPTAA